jgi:cell division protein FtsQ
MGVGLLPVVSKRLTWGLSFIFLVLVGAFLFLRSPFFHISEFVVQGNSIVPEGEIVARCGQNAANIFAFDVDKASELVESSPWIENARCQRKLPDTVIVTVTERTPVAFAPVGESNYLVDKHGRVLDEDDGSRDGLVALTGVLGPVSPGYFLDDAAYGWGLRVLLALGDISRPKVTEINVQGSDCTLILDDGCKVLMGSEDSLAHERVSLLEAILADLAKEGTLARQIDLRFDKPTVRR